MQSSQQQAIGLRASEIPEGGSRAFAHAGEKYFAVKKYGKIYAYKNSCPHIGVGLEWVENQFLDSSGCMIQCANHGALFVIETGKCVAGPCSGQKLTAMKFTLHDDFIVLD
jgi:nitrite reductase/ring-hydroxylating ferredoxin subunit